MADAPFDCEPFEPDHDLVVKLAEYLSNVPRGQADMVNAYGILIHLYDLGIEMPVAHTDGPEQKPGRKSHDATSDRAPVSVTFCMDDGCRYAAGHDGPHDITWQDAHRDGADDAR